ncbi:MAG TPA: redoxin domain-containing protein [Chloroflexaceae bacterium]|nr:redoxin domain-containing protein [Chloroflexaceae bacterium]
MHKTPALSETAPRLKTRAVAPNFTLPALAGGEVTRSAYRARKHLALVFLPADDAAARAYLASLTRRYADLRAADSELLAILADPAASAEGLRAGLELPFPLLLDPEGRAAARYLPDDAPLGAFILDRYGAVQKQWALTAPPLPPADELIEWLEVVDRMCVL